MNNLSSIALTTIILASSVSYAAEDVYDLLRGTPATPQISPAAMSQLQAAAAQTNSNEDNASTTSASTQGFRPTTLREEAFKEVLNKTFPMNPEQIRELHKEHDKSQAAIRATPNAPPQPKSSTLTVDLSPGATPPVVRLATGFVTSIVFVDTTGQAWPVADYSLGNPNGFNIKWDNKTNALFIQSTQDYLTGNMAVRLVNLETPIMISIVTGQRDVDYRVDVQVPGYGPNASAPVLDNPLPGHASSALLSALDGVPPVGSIELKINKEYGRAWIYNDRLLFRTKLTLLSPAWTSSVSGSDGTKVYELMKTPLLLVSQHGKPVKIELAGL